MRDATVATLVREVMSRTVIGVPPGMSVADALELANEHAISHLPVIEGGHARGLVCTCDLEEAELGADVFGVMHTPAVDIDPERTLGEAAAVMSKTGVGSLVVVSAQEIVGMLTRTDFERIGLAKTAFADNSCTGCGSYHHVHADAGGIWWCSACRAHRGPAAPEELGSGD